MTDAHCFGRVLVFLPPPLDSTALDKRRNVDRECCVMPTASDRLALPDLQAMRWTQAKLEAPQWFPAASGLGRLLYDASHAFCDVYMRIRNYKENSAGSDQAFD